jgi:hypothetical protein
VLVAVNPAGPFNTVSIITEYSSAMLSSTCTVQVKTTVDPMGRTGLGTLLDSITEVGAGTVFIYYDIVILFLQYSIRVMKCNLNLIRDPSLNSTHFEL